MFKGMARPLAKNALQMLVCLPQKENMLLHLRIRIRCPSRDNRRFSSVLNPILNQTPNPSQTLTLKMPTQSASKRPICASCSKPTRVCFCSRIQTSGLETSVAVTILQHSQERKHPLNSARIATLGLKNLTVATVFDVNFEARFPIQFLDSDTDVGSVGNDEKKSSSLCGCHNVSENSNFDQVLENINGSNTGSGNASNLEFERFLKNPEEKSIEIIDDIVECSLRNGPKCSRNCPDQCENTDFMQNLDPSTNDVLVLEPEHELAIEECVVAKGSFGLENSQNHLVKQCNLDMVSASFMVDKAISDDKAEVIKGDELSQLDFDPLGAVPRGIEGPAITATIGKKGFNCSFSYHWMPKTQRQEPNFDQLLASPATVDDLAKGFVVKKLQKRQLNKSEELEEYEEFELKVPPGSVLLFPTDNAIGVEDINFEVKNVIVLDATWTKAKRMYKENPWLKLLPHLKLEPKKMSLYGEVRLQPKPGCLSTIESIVYALKAVGENPEGLDHLLDVFESMVEDQRRCKDERLSTIPQE